MDAVDDFNSEPSYRSTVLNNTYNQHVGGAIFNAAAFGPPSVGADVFSNPNVAKRNLLWGPGTWSVNLGVYKDFQLLSVWYFSSVRTSTTFSPRATFA